MISTAEFEQLFFEYQPRLVRFAVRYLEEEAAEDIVQNAGLNETQAGIQLAGTWGRK